MSELVQVLSGEARWGYTNSGSRLGSTALGTIPDNSRDQDEEKDGAQEVLRWQSCAKTSIGGEAHTLLLNPSCSPPTDCLLPEPHLAHLQKRIWVSVLTL